MSKKPKYIELPVKIGIDDVSETWGLTDDSGEVVCFGIIMLDTAEFIRDAVNKAGE